MKRRKMPWVIGTIMAASFVMLVILQSTNLWKDFTIDSSSDLVLLYALSGLNFAALIIFGFIFLRSIIKLARERRTFTLGAQIKTRLLIYFFALSLMPIIAMAVFSYLFMNRALDRWFTSIPENVLRETKEMQRQSLLDRTAKLDETARMLAKAFEKAEPNSSDLASVAVAGSLVHIGLLDRNQATVASYDRELTADERAELDRLLAAAKTGNAADPSLRDGKGFDVGLATLSGGRTLVVVPDPFGERTLSQVVERSVAEFEGLKNKQLTIRRVGLLTLGVLTFLLMFASSWIAFHVARGLTAPIKALAEGANEIARGNLGHRVDVLAEDELALLVTTFNEMSATLESNSIELSDRRRYIETVLETLPTGVISFDANDRISTINRAAADILKLDGRDLSAAKLADIVNVENRLVLERLLGRARRVGHASDQTALGGQGSNGNGYSETEITVALTASKLPTDGGVVLVIEDLSESIAAQRASAWQEVARRMAHEIKNPLTPIQLSAERIAKRFSNSGHEEMGSGNRITDQGPIANVVNESTETILREVASLKTMVDEFSRFARLPDTKLEAGDLNRVIEQAETAFDGRFTRLVIDLGLADSLPEVLIDPEQLKRVFVNLIENSVEAFDGNAEEPRIVVTTRHDAARDLVIAEVSDNGKGIAPADLQKLFQPYFSTKGRGTGLGLAIVNRIIAEHNGKIKVVANQPKGAKFIIELPVNG
ncbi:MAG: HAMP domain-containing protein [Acidobacteria bacterium]|nr:HAMP domain-containing protein [Acidobacteriota bacterium]